MAVMYFEFLVNLPDSDNCKFALPSVDYIALHGPKGEIISISWSLSNDYYVKDGIYCGRFKGLEVKIEKNENGEEKLFHDYEEMTEEDLDLIKKSEIYEIGVSEDDSLPENYDFTSFVTDENLKIEICFCKEIAKSVSKKFDII